MVLSDVVPEVEIVEILQVPVTKVHLMGIVIVGQQPELVVLVHLFCPIVMLLVQVW